MSSKFLLDTTFLVDLQRGDTACRELLMQWSQAQTTPLLATPVMAEYLSGFADASGEARRLLGGADPVDLDVPAAIEAGRFARQRRKQGSFPGWSDCMIAGIAIRHEATIVTRNAHHFAPLPTKTY